MALLQLPKNFKFYFLNHFPLPQQGEVGASSSSTPSIILFDDSPSAITYDLVHEDAKKGKSKKKKVI